MTKLVKKILIFILNNIASYYSLFNELKIIISLHGIVTSSKYGKIPNVARE